MYGGVAGSFALPLFITGVDFRGTCPPAHTVFVAGRVQSVSMHVEV